MRRYLALLGLLLPLAAHAEVNQLHVTRQPSIIYLAPIIMEQQKLVEAEAAKLGLPGLTTKWTVFSSGGSATDTLLAGNVDVVTTGASNMLLLWGSDQGRRERPRRRGGAAASGDLPQPGGEVPA